MTITINGELLTIKSSMLVDVLQNFGAKPPFAVALNGEFIPQSLHASTTINEGDSIELLSPIQGG
ncbi:MULTISPECIES: sulfur carrier protein ThiS [Pseudoalteromonas]|jgi:sulfur carrier protein|uniref:Thiamine biosynthesis protein ThiS n=1 Tax=Pseudoalteromonas agarivorans TaxID=176102 RepID=A0ABR5VNC6_9GAMM|nr:MULTISPECIES: sulfur carrier protein ThiS [Pseudoalteromonas]KPW05409.1 sulfur carrier protein ThiS [Pseudoalteromonas sp. P1-11]KYL31577.1 thiamine biosynthesis protein ThiS [Pseudoalteromonas telluritireducens]MDC9497028.1 sulfur carrier protein ThiS [Pseudoalteromonas sp. Angola-20]MDC9515935.1 sulfur carrier protein ThiS [Pseudoalteromonas sp. Angola-22]MDC9532378.1 sulfur carrier protein ThiS [Pseudoalteromonas sp. Angola-9]|tara:strand:- start:90 stop:284 length:195 start_codon:yes stop_codon:yes gene_type:complete